MAIVVAALIQLQLALPALDDSNARNFSLNIEAFRLFWLLIIEVVILAAGWPWERCCAAGWGSCRWFYRHAGPQAPDFLPSLSSEVAAFKTLPDRFIWIAGEHTAVMPFRPMLLGIPSLCVPYWRRGGD